MRPLQLICNYRSGKHNPRPLSKKLKKKKNPFRATINLMKNITTSVFVCLRIVFVWLNTWTNTKAKRRKIKIVLNADNILCFVACYSRGPSGFLLKKNKKQKKHQVYFFFLNRNYRSWQTLRYSQKRIRGGPVRLFRNVTFRMPDKTPERTWPKFLVY